MKSMQATWRKQIKAEHKEMLGDRDIFPFAQLRATGDDKTCSFCGGLNGKIFLIDKVPLPPFRSCTCHEGCRCNVAYIMQEELAAYNEERTDTRTIECPRCAAGLELPPGIQLFDCPECGTSIDAHQRTDVLI